MFCTDCLVAINLMDLTTLASTPNLANFLCAPPAAHLFLQKCLTVPWLAAPPEASGSLGENCQLGVEL